MRTDAARFTALASFAGVLMLAAACCTSGAERVSKWPKWQRRRVALDQCYVSYEFRIYYALDGPDALPQDQRRDTNGNGVPDRIENTALQLVAARRIYHDVMKLRHPFDSPRYKDKVKFFDVNVWDLPTNGSAGDGVVNYHRPSDPPEGVQVLTIDLQRKLNARNLTPAHELFHQFQHGYTLFKNSWRCSNRIDGKIRTVSETGGRHP